MYDGNMRRAMSGQGAAFSLGNRQNTRWMGSGAARMQGGRVTPGCCGFAACAFPASPYVAIKRASRVSSVVSVNSRNPRSLFILHRKGFVHCPQPFTADIVSSTMVICDERWTAASCYSGSGIHLGNLKSGRKESRVCFMQWQQHEAHSRQGAAFT